MQRKQTLSLHLKTPTLGWELEFISVYESKSQIIAVANLTKGGACDAIGDCHAEMNIDQTELYAKPVKYYILAEGLKGWYLQSRKFTAIESLDSIKPLVNNMQQIYSLHENNHDYRL